MQLVAWGAAGFFVSLYIALQVSWLASYRLCFLAGLALCFTSLLLVKSRRGLAVSLCAFFLLLGLWSGGGVGQSAAEQLHPYVGQQVVARGRVEPASVRQGNGYVSFLLQCERFESAEEATVYTGRLRVALPEKSISADETQIVAVEGILQEQQGFRVPGAFDGALWNRVNNVGGRLAKAKLLQAASVKPTVLERFTLLNFGLRERLRRAVPGQEGAVLCGMILGGSSGLDEETRDIFTANGLAHLLSVSGTHLLLLTKLLFFAFQRAVFLPKIAHRPLLLLVLLFYALLCGLRPPVLRALAMSGVLLWSNGEQGQKGVLLSLVAVVLLVVKPLWLFDIGFQLSFAASLGLVYLLPKCKDLFCRVLPEWLGEGLAVTMAAQLAVLPLQLGYFHQLSMISFLSNLLLLPLLELCALLGLLGVAMDAVLSVSAGALSLSRLILHQVLLQGSWLGGLPCSTITIGSLPVWSVVLYYAFLCLWVDFPPLQILSSRERRVAMNGLALVLGGLCFWQSWASRPLTVYFLDVGQGDCAVITKDDKVAVIDTGGLKGINTGSRLVAPFIRSLGKSSVDLLLLTHYDFDHGGGAAGVLKQLQVKELLLPAGEPQKEEQQLYVNLQKALNAKTALWQKRPVIRRAFPGLAYDFSGARLTIIAAEEAGGNDGSTVTVLEGVGGRSLFTGDLGRKGEEKLADIGSFDVLKVAHHGSRSGSTEEFLKQVRPRVAAISCGAGNRFGHPHREVLERLEAVGSKILRTDRLGTLRVVFTANPVEPMEISTYDGRAWRRLH